ncbi:conjugal transfer protein TraX [Paenibacillus sp. CC-CFT747]|nr:conjugal transfer protein TraX [Paenibacillus sp. CC-CFT747]
MQIVAMLTMLIDHIGFLYFPESPGWRVIGRLAFPIYAYFIVRGYRHTSSVKAYMTRLLLLAAVSQLPYMLALKQTGINAIGTLYVCLLALYLLERKSRTVSLPLRCSSQS